MSYSSPILHKWYARTAETRGWNFVSAWTTSAIGNKHVFVLDVPNRFRPSDLSYSHKRLSARNAVTRARPKMCGNSVPTAAESFRSSQLAGLDSQGTSNAVPPVAIEGSVTFANPHSFSRSRVQFRDSMHSLSARLN